MAERITYHWEVSRCLRVGGFFRVVRHASCCLQYTGCAALHAGHAWSLGSSFKALRMDVTGCKLGVLHGKTADEQSQPAADYHQIIIPLFLNLECRPTLIPIPMQVMKALVATDRLDQYAASAVGASSPGDLVSCRRPKANQLAKFSHEDADARAALFQRPVS